MFDTIYQLTDRAVLAPRQMETLLTNMANAGVPGYRAQQTSIHSFSQTFNHLLHEFSLPQTRVTMKEKINLGVGPLKPTGRSLDFAIPKKEGFFTVRTPEGNLLYTRNGSFSVNQNWELVTREGYLVIGNNGVIRFNRQDNLENLRVNEEGLLQIVDRDQIRNIGKFQIVSIPQDELQRIGVYYFIPRNPQQVRTIEKYEVVNTYLEQSNTNLIMEMAQMIEVTRLYERIRHNINQIDQNLSEYIKLNQT